MDYYSAPRRRPAMAEYYSVDIPDISVQFSQHLTFRTEEQPRHVVEQPEAVRSKYVRKTIKPTRGGILGENVKDMKMVTLKKEDVVEEITDEQFDELFRARRRKIAERTDYWVYRERDPRYRENLYR